ncbi:MAG: translational GTPase TypA [Erysipelotrichaceae bacterium]|nr:translational GTPase TypA [Erysipelotrichaceae bacterium]MBQ2685009.1 translational GTPase TypA [Erysipelotrichaceae bacterium]
MSKQKIINIAVIAHVDAGKSTLVDAFLNQSGVFKPNEEVGELIMDSNDLERERGITIYSKNCSVFYKDYKINIVDTPGHADFSSEVERIIKTVDTVILLVDSSEGPMPQTRFVLQKSLELGLRPILLINKIDKKDARSQEVIDLVYELFFDLDANDEQINFPILYGIAKDGIVKYHEDDPDDGIKPLFETIINYVKPYPDLDDEPLQMQVSNLAYDEYIGRLGIGRVYKGTLKTGEQVVLCKNDGSQQRCTITKLFIYEGIKRKPVNEARSGDIVIIAGIPDISIGETVCDKEFIDPLPPIHIDEPTLSMNFMVNTSPFAGRSGKYVTSRNLKERLERELEVNVGLRVEPTDTTDTFKVSGRGELGLTILIENMRREGYELGVGKPQVIYKYIDGRRYEPVERVICEVPKQYEGAVINRLNMRNGQMVNITERNNYVNIEFLVSTRGLIGFRSEFINMTRGEGILVRNFEDYMPYMGEINTRGNGVMISNANGVAMTYSIWNLQERGQFFIGPQTEVYEGMIVGVCSKDMDMEVNPTKNKKATAVRSEGRDEAMKLVTPIQLTLEYALEFIDDDELVEVTPDAIRLRKRYLTSMDRRNAFREKKKLEESE